MEKRYFPLFMDISRKNILVVGGGRIAARRVRTLLAFTDKITLVAPVLDPSLHELVKAGQIHWVCRNWEEQDLAGQELVLAITADREINSQIEQCCKERQILFNRADDQTRCDFFFPAIVKKEHTVIGISSSGKSPEITKQVRKNIEKEKFVVILSFTRAGSVLNEQLVRQLREQGYESAGYTVPRFAKEYGLAPLPEHRQEWIGDQWGVTSFVFIGATGIALRSVAPFVRDKFTDSAVVVLDERGEHVIPLLSSHLGGGMKLGRIISQVLKGQLIATTATDVQGIFAIDVFARDNQLQIDDRALAKQISAALLEGEQIGFYSEYPLTETFPEEVVLCQSKEQLKQYPYGVAVVKERTDQYDSGILQLVSTDEIVVGVGCRKNADPKVVEKAFWQLLQKCQLKSFAVKTLASIDLKQAEKALLELADQYHLSFLTYSVAELETVNEVSTRSSFVEETTGVDNVCERAARLACPIGEWLQEKTIIDGVTFAVRKRKKAGKRILLFAGTTEGRQIAEYLRGSSHQLYISVATEYGKTSFEDIGWGEVLCGRMDAASISAFITDHEIDLVIDATHPFAQVVTENIKAACEGKVVDYLRCIREEIREELGSDLSLIRVPSIAAAVEYLKSTTGNILIATGSKELSHYTAIDNYQERCYARVLSTEEAVAESARLGFSGNHLIAMQGPFSKELNIATLSHIKAQYFVTKESGPSGGLAEKIAAARETNTSLIIIEKPPEEGLTVAAVCRYIDPA